MSNNRDSFIFYRSFFEAITSLEKEQKAEIYEAICTYALDEKITELSGVAKGFFALIKPQLDANIKRFKNGCQKKQIRSKTEAKPKQNRSKTEANNNVNPNVNPNLNPELELKKENLLPKVPLQKKESAKTSFALDFKKLSEENQSIGLSKYNEMRLKAQLTHDQIQEYLDKFDEFWRSYTPIKDKEGAIVPRGDKKNCRLRYLRLLYSGEKHVEIMKGLEIYLKVCITAKRQSVGAAVFLNQERWRSDYIGEVIETPGSEAPYTSHIRQTIRVCNEAMAKHAERERLKQKQDS